jgi:hypothetical protein
MKRDSDPSARVPGFLEPMKAKLVDSIPPGDWIYDFTKDIKELLARAQKMGLEGLIGKRGGSRYEAGRRNGAWVKIKLHKEQEFVIGGYAEPEAARKYFGALLVGFYEGKNFKFAGSVGTGFSARCLTNCGKFELRAVPFLMFRHPAATDGTRG